MGDSGSDSGCRAGRRALVHGAGVASVELRLYARVLAVAIGLASGINAGVSAIGPIEVSRFVDHGFDLGTAALLDALIAVVVVGLRDASNAKRGGFQFGEADRGRVLLHLCFSRSEER